MVNMDGLDRIISMSVVKQLDNDLKGAPDKTLTVILIVIAAVTVYVAFFANPTIKAIVAAWLIAP